MKHNHETNTILADRFGKDSLIALATVEGVSLMSALWMRCTSMVPFM